MEINNKIPFIDVVTMSKELCEYGTGEEWEIIYVPITLKENGENQKYLSVMVCPKEDVEKALLETTRFDGKDKEEYTINPKYCHIATFPEDTKRREVDFDNESDSSIKANFNKEYDYVDVFFRRFINFRNNLIENKQVVKRDDIYQYFLSLTGFDQSKKKNNHKSK